MSDLFIDNFPIVRTDKELEALKVRFPKYDPYYIASGSIEFPINRKKIFEELYSRYKTYADKHFLQEVKINFHQRSWEMYLTCVLLENGFDITSDDRGPDIKLVVGDKTIWIECIAPTQGEGIESVPDILLGRVQNVPTEAMTLRLSSALAEKFRKHEEYLRKKIIDADDIFIIAINRGAFSYPDTTAPLIFNCLFSLGDLTLPIRVGVRKPGEPYYAIRENLGKKNGSVVPMNFFEDQQHAGISAVIYSTEAVLNHPEKIGDDCILVHNQFAKNSLSEDTFSFFVQYKEMDNKIVEI